MGSISKLQLQGSLYTNACKGRFERWFLPAVVEKLARFVYKLTINKYRSVRKGLYDLQFWCSALNFPPASMSFHS
jgi:hypothetical protein